MDPSRQARGLCGRCLSNVSSSRSEVKVPANLRHDLWLGIRAAGVLTNAELYQGLRVKLRIVAAAGGSYYLRRGWKPVF